MQSSAIDVNRETFDADNRWFYETNSGGSFIRFNALDEGFVAGEPTEATFGAFTYYRGSLQIDNTPDDRAYAIYRKPA